MTTTLQTVGILVSCCIAVGGILIYIGQSLKTLQQIGANQEFLFKRTDKHQEDIARIDKELTQVKTRQEDCEKCP